MFKKIDPIFLWLIPIPVAMLAFYMFIAETNEFMDETLDAAAEDLSGGGDELTIDDLDPSSQIEIYKKRIVHHNSMIDLCERYLEQYRRDLRNARAAGEVADLKITVEGYLKDIDKEEREIDKIKAKIEELERR